MLKSIKKRAAFIVGILLLSISWAYPPSVQALPEQPDRLMANAYELIDEVNSLRASRGLPAYSVNSILMNVAQAQSDYQAAIGSVTHYGPGGTRPYQRALAAGYPLAGDLTQGGFFSENIMAGPGLTAQAAVKAWMGDDPHLNTMLSPNLTEVGAGVSCSDDYCYFTLDAAQPSGSAPVYTPSSGGGSTGLTPIAGATSLPTRVVVIPNTPKADGTIAHVVQPGETLYTISLAYKVSVDEIKSINRLSNDMIYPGNTLIIRLPAATQTSEPTATSTIEPTFTPFVFHTVTPPATGTATPLPSAPVSGNSGMVAVGVIIGAAILLSGIVTFASGRKKRE